MNLKYIIVEDAHGIATPILFPANLTHRQVAAGMGAEYPGRIRPGYIVMQGVCCISQRDDGRFQVTTQSDSATDELIIERMLNSTGVPA